MKLPGLRGSDQAIKVREEPHDSRSDFQDPLPPVTRHELLTRLGMDDEPEIVGMPTLLIVDTEPAAAA